VNSPPGIHTIPGGAAGDVVGAPARVALQIGSISRKIKFNLTNASLYSMFVYRCLRAMAPQGEDIERT